MKIICGADHAGVEAKDAIVAQLADECRDGDVVLVMSNGDFEGIWQKLLDAFARRS